MHNATAVSYTKAFCDRKSAQGAAIMHTSRRPADTSRAITTKLWTMDTVLTLFISITGRHLIVYRIKDWLRK